MSVLLSSSEGSKWRDQTPYIQNIVGGVFQISRTFVPRRKQCFESVRMRAGSVTHSNLKRLHSNIQRLTLIYLWI